MSSIDANTHGTAEDQCAPARRGDASASLRVPALVFVLVVSCLVFLRALTKDPILFQQFTQSFRPSQASLQEKELAKFRLNDPPLGSVLPLPGPSSEAPAPPPSPGAGRSVPVSHCSLVVMIGPCSVCMRSALDLADEFTKKHPAVKAVAVSPSSMRELQNFREINHLRLQMVTDAGKRLARRYNAAWTPRAYLLSSGGALLWCQNDSTFTLQPAQAALAKQESHR